MDVSTLGSAAKPGTNLSQSNWSRVSIVFSFINGMVDIMGWLTLGGFFAANITGDFVIAIADVVRGQQLHLLQLLAIPFYIGGVFLALVLAQRLGRQSVVQLRVLLLLQCLLLMCALTISVVLHPAPSMEGTPAVLIGLCAVSSIGVQNAVMRLADKQAPTTWALTANSVTAIFALMTLIHQNQADRTEAIETWQFNWRAIVAFLIGALVGAVAFSLLHTWAWAVPSVTTLLVLGVSWNFTRTTSL